MGEAEAVETDINFVNHLGERLFGTHHRPDVPSESGVVLGHCFTCTRHTGILREAGARLADAGFHVLRFDFSGNGQSEGVFIETSYTKYIAEMEVAANFLKADGVKWLGFAGHSMGAAVSVLAGARLSGIQAICAIAGRLTGMDPLAYFQPGSEAAVPGNRPARIREPGPSAGAGQPVSERHAVARHAGGRGLSSHSPADRSWDPGRHCSVRSGRKGAFSQSGPLGTRHHSRRRSFFQPGGTP